MCHITAQKAVIISFFNDAVQFCSAHYFQLDSIAPCPSFDDFNPAEQQRASRKDKHLHSSFHPTSWILRVADIGRVFTGVIRVPSLPPFIMSYSNPIPGTPRVISPSPTPSERDNQQEGYFGPVTRSAKKKALASAKSINEDIEDESTNVELRRARSKSRSSMRQRKLSELGAAKAPSTLATIKEPPIEINGSANENGKATNGHLSPAAASKGWSWRDISRSPSPLGLIPIHRQFRSFVHRHEVPRKLLHVSIGFLSLWFYVSGVQTTAITPWLMAALIPIAATDYLRHTYSPVNRFYVKVLGMFMRESEFDGWNGVIWYLLGAWIVLGFFAKDVGLMGILLLSWCDTAASTVGRAYGRYTPRIRKGKSLAGSLAAFAVGVITAASFWGWLAPQTGPFPDDDNFPFMFTGTLSLPEAVRIAVGLTESQASISGALALGILSVWTGFVASASEVVDIFGWDDNLTIPVLSGLGMWGFLKVFA